MKLIKFCIKNCGECVYLKYKYDIEYNLNQYYCDLIHVFIDNEIDIRSSVSNMCPLEDCLK